MQQEVWVPGEKERVPNYQGIPVAYYNLPTRYVGVKASVFFSSESGAKYVNTPLPNLVFNGQATPTITLFIPTVDLLKNI